MDVTALTAKAQLQLATPDLTDQEILDILNEGIRDIASRYTWPFQFTTETISLVDGTTTYALPANLLQVVELLYDGEAAGTPLERLTIPQAAAKFGDVPGDDALPRYYVQEGLNLTFYPTPDAAQDVFVKGYTMPADLEDPTDEPPFHQAFHAGLLDYVYAQFWEKEELEERASYYWNRYFNTIQRMALFYDAQLPPERLIIGAGTPTLLPLPFDNWPEVWLGG